MRNYCQLPRMHLSNYTLFKNIFHSKNLLVLSFLFTREFTFLALNARQISSNSNAISSDNNEHDRLAGLRLHSTGIKSKMQSSTRKRSKIASKLFHTSHHSTFSLLFLPKKLVFKNFFEFLSFNILSVFCLYISTAA